MTHASVFSGIGGPEVAASMLGWENLFHCEINPFGRAVLDYWYPNAESYEDITKTDFTEWRGRIDVLTGGFPCQPFSFAGKRRGADDDRYLWPFMFKCIDQIRPTWVVGENVAGIVTMVEQGQTIDMADAPTLFDEDGAVHRYEYRSTFTLERICRDLETHGYDVQPVLIPACAVGAPHRRDRVFIVGRRISADTESVGQLDGDRQERSAILGRSHLEATQRGVDATEFYGKSESPADTSDAGLQHGHQSEGEGCKTGAIQGQGHNPFWDVYAQADGYRGETAEAEWSGCAGNGRWQHFPTVSPVHRGNDGLPFDVDCLTIPFTKWRNEALKAYGNAIVPQVMYEIFRAIEQVENER